MAVADRGAMYDPSAVFYMDKLVTGPAAQDVVDIEAPVEHNVQAVAKAKGCSAEDVTVVVLDRPRHEELVREIREAGARIRFITDGDVAGAIMAARDGTGVDLLLGIGGTPEGHHRRVRREVPRRRHPRQALAPRRRGAAARRIDAGHDLDRVLDTDDLVRGDNVFFVATGVTDGELLEGVRYRAGGASTHSLVMRSKSGTIRSIHSDHQADQAAGLQRHRLRPPRLARPSPRASSCSDDAPAHSASNDGAAGPDDAHRSVGRANREGSTDMAEDTVVLDTLADMTATSIARGTLDGREHMIARLAALVAVDAPAASYLLNAGVAAEVGLTLDDVQGLLIAVAPIVGTPRVVTAAANIADALGIAVAVLEAELDADLE